MFPHKKNNGKKEMNFSQKGLRVISKAAQRQNRGNSAIMMVKSVFLCKRTCFGVGVKHSRATKLYIEVDGT